MTYLVQLFFSSFFCVQVSEKVVMQAELSRWAGGVGFIPNRFIETLKIGGIIARGCL